VIEAATTSDFAAIAALNVAAYEQFAPHLKEGAWIVMQQNLSNISERARSAEFFVCREAGTVVGSVAYCPAGRGDPSVFQPDMASVLLLAVHPEHCGKGLARKLTEACIARARQDGAAAIGLFTSELMVPAQHLYRDLGFQLESELPPRHGVRYFRFILPLAVKGVDG